VGTARRLMRLPWLSIGIAAACIANMVIPSLGALFIFDRIAVANGELWRIVTAHLVHYTDSHLIANLIVLLPAMVLVEMDSRKDLLRVLIVSAAAIGMAVFVLEPNLLHYAGASGIALALITYVALRGLAGTRRWRMVCTTMLAVAGFKLFAEIGFGWRWLEWGHVSGIVTVTLAHLVGFASGLSIWLAQIVWSRDNSFVARGRAPMDQPRHAS